MWLKSVLAYSCTLMAKYSRQSILSAYFFLQSFYLLCAYFLKIKAFMCLIDNVLTKRSVSMGVTACLDFNCDILLQIPPVNTGLCLFFCLFIFSLLSKYGVELIGNVIFFIFNLFVS